MKSTYSLLLLLMCVAYCMGQGKTAGQKGQRLDPQIINHWYCPDAVKVFPPINIKSWAKTPVVTGRLPTWEETENGK